MTDITQARCQAIAGKLRDLANELYDFGDIVDDAPVVEEAPAAPVETKVQYATTSKFPKGRTIQDFLDANWTHVKMIKEGYIVEVIIEPDGESAITPPPPADEENAPTPPADEEPAHILTPKAGGATYAALIDNGWTDEKLIKHGLMEVPAASAELEQTCPFKDGDGNWIDSEGTVHDSALHADASKPGEAPPLTAKKVFKKSKKRAKVTPEAPAAPAAPDDPPPPPADEAGAPLPPPADETGAPLPPPDDGTGDITPPASDEPLCPDLEAIIKDFP